MLGRMDVIVVGAGVVGLTSAIRLAESGRRVAVWTAEPPRQTTSAVAGAMCGPNVPYGEERPDRWGKIADTVFRELAGLPGTGVRLTRGRLATRSADGPPPWASAIPGFALCAPEQSAGFPSAFWVELPTADMPRYLDYLTARLAAAGGELVPRRITDLTEAAEAAPVVVNCTGAAARDLAGDDRVRAVKGQHVIVANPGLDTFFYEALAGTTWAGFFPYGEHVVLGGVRVEDDWDRTPDPELTEAILARCVAVEPRLAGAEILTVEAGLRPVRDTPRLEREDLGSAVCIHNYGHGGIGVTWSWGSADDVLAFVP